MGDPPVASGAAANSATAQFVLPGHVEPIALCPRRHDDRVSIDRAAVRTDPERPLFIDVDPNDGFRLEDGVELYGLSPHHRDHGGTGDVEQPQIIFNVHR